jgi:hypothetical protein
MTAPRYSDRKRLAETGSVGPLSYEAPDAFRAALKQVLSDLDSRGPAGKHAIQTFSHHCAQHFGFHYKDWIETWIRMPMWITYDATTDDLLDLIEILVEEATRKLTSADGQRTMVPWADIETRLNRLFERHRFGFRLERGEVRRVGSPALDEFVVGPALQALRRPGWEQAERSFREALHHQRGGSDERDDALTAATAALEAALKAAGLKGDRLSALAKDLRNSGLVPGQLAGVPEALDTLLKRSGAIRDPLSDAHGKSPGAEEVPAELVDLSIYWTGAFINYLSAATS